jgi:tetratricopeptide (TPR) repeat protein
MKQIKILIILLSICNFAFAQLTTPPNGGNKKAIVGERIGITDVVINYHRPRVKGREERIWGGIVYKGFQKQSIGTTKAAPWRAGANENTTISFSTDVKVEGKDLPAGTYGFFIAYDSLECIAIFSKDITAWGNFYYNEQNDALRVKVKPVKTERSTEWLEYKFLDQANNAATIALAWEKLMIPFKVEVDLHKTQLASFRKELISNAALFRWELWNQAARYCMQNNVNLEEGLVWSEQAIFWAQGDNKFIPYMTKFQILDKLNRKLEGDSVMAKAVEIGNSQNLYTYAYLLTQQYKNTPKAMEVHQLNGKKNPTDFFGLWSLTYFESNKKNYKKALEYAKQALPMAPHAQAKRETEAMIKKLEEGKDIN